MDAITVRNQAVYEERMKCRLEEHRQALQDWKDNLRILPMALRRSSHAVETQASREMAR